MNLLTCAAVAALLGGADVGRPVKAKAMLDAMNKGDLTRFQGSSIGSQFTAIGMCAEAIFGNATLHLYLLSAKFQRVLFVFGQV